MQSGRAGQLRISRPRSIRRCQLRRRSLRHAGAPVRLCGDAGAVCHPRRRALGPAARACLRSPPRRRAGAWPTARTRPSPSASSIFSKKQRLTRFSGIPGRPQGRDALDRRRRASPWRSSKSTAPAANSRPGPATAASRRPDGPGRPRELEAAGVIDSKFGPVDAASPSAGARTARACLGFLKRIDEPALQISGWSCQGDSSAGPPRAIGCMLNRLTLLTAGNDPKLAELFAQRRTQARRL